MACGEGPAVVVAAGLGCRRAGPRILVFTDVAGKAGRLSELRDRKALVICMTSATCPVAQKYGPTLVELEKRVSRRRAWRSSR